MIRRRPSLTTRFDVVVVVTGTTMRSTIHTTTTTTNTTTTTTDIITATGIRVPIGRFDLLHEFVDIPPGPRGRDGRCIGSTGGSSSSSGRCSCSVRRSDNVGGGLMFTRTTTGPIPTQTDRTTTGSTSSSSSK